MNDAAAAASAAADSSAPAAPAADTGRRMKAGWAGKCACGARVEAGATMWWAGREGGIVGCAACRPAGGEATEADATITNGGGGGGAGPVCGTYAVEVVRRRFGSDVEAGWACRLVAAEGEAQDAAHEDAPVAPGATFTVIATWAPRPEDLYEVTGTWSTAPQGYVNLRGVAIPSLAADERSVATLLGKLTNFGRVRSQKALEYFGGPEMVLDVLDHAPERLAEISGITPARAAEAHRTWVDLQALREVVIRLGRARLSGRATQRILREYAGDMARLLTVLDEDPYTLVELEGVGFAAIDQGRDALGVTDPDDPRRLAAGVAECLRREAADGGHCIAHPQPLTGRWTKLGFARGQFVEAIDHALDKGRVVEYGNDGMLQLAALAAAEAHLAAWVLS
jgi:hypothetical protein